ncbi:MAG: TlpA family protein disulfide reductase [Deltaproteobacteria bacterium]|nr:TlpA family protein disulfide reductase [Deltaproteobacteria bacterium]
MLASKYGWVARCAVGLALTICSCAGKAPAASYPSALLSKPVPAFKRPTLDGSTFDTGSARGKVMVVKFFAKYCEPCKKTLPKAEALHKDRSDIVFVGISEDESEVDAREVKDSYGLTFPIVHDRGNVLSGRFRVSDLPITFVVSADGNIKWVGGPDQSEDDLARAVQ